MIKLRKLPVLFVWLMIALLYQTACAPSYYKIVKSEIPPASGRGNITGKVLSETDGKPLENVEVMLCLDAVMLVGCSRQIGQTKTNQDGIYWFRNLPPGNYVPAIKQSKTAVYVLQEKKKGEYFPKAVLFNLEAGQTIRIEPQKINIETQNSEESIPNLTFPINFETIQERKPKLTWKEHPDAEDYTPYLVKINPLSGEYTDVKLESGSLASIKTNSVLPVNELEDGIYHWGVYVSGKKNTKTIAENAKATGYFVVIDTEQVKK